MKYPPLYVLFVCLFYGDHFTTEALHKAIFFKKLNLQPCMNEFSQALIQVVDSTHYNTENIRKVNLCSTLAKVFSMDTHK